MATIGSVDAVPEAVVFAAGEGRRLRPLTHRWAKTLLPIEGRPVIATLLRELASSGIETVTLVVGHLGEQVEEFVGDGSAFGVRIRYARQPEPLGSADAVARGIAAGARAPLVACAADTVFRPRDVARATERWLASGAGGGLAVRPVPLEELPQRSSVRVEGGRVVQVREKPAPGTAEGGLAGAPLWFLDAGLAASLPGVAGPPFELATVFQAAIDAGRDVLALEVGPTKDLTRPEDVVLRNFPYLWER